MEKDFNEILKYLHFLGIDSISGEEMKMLKEMFDYAPSTKQLKRELDLLCAINKTLVSSYGAVSIRAMNKINEEIDFRLIMKLYDVYEEIKGRCRNSKEGLNEFKKAVHSILNINTQVNSVVKEDIENELDKIAKIKNSLYLTMDDKKKADMFLDSCMKRVKNFIRQCDRENLESIINHLKSNYSLSNDELVKISKKCATLFTMSSVMKIKNISQALDELKVFIEDKLVLDGQSKISSKMSGKSMKDIIIDSTSIMAVNPDALKKTIGFLMGEKIGDVRGEFTSIQLAKIYTESITSLSTSVEKIEDVCKNVCLVYKKYFHDDLDVNGFINGYNFSSISQLRKEDYFKEGKIEEIFNILSKFISKEDMEKLLKNNLSFLIVSVEDVENSLRKAILSSQNQDELRRNVLQKIKNHFDIYENVNYKRKANIGPNDEKIKVGSLSKIDIKSFDEEQILQLLVELKATSDDIDAWNNRWNEEKENLELQLEIDLEEILENLEVLESFLDEKFVDLESYIKDTLSNKNLYLELLNKYELIIKDNVISSGVVSLNERVKAKFNKIADKINSNLEKVIADYKTQIKNLSDSVSKIMEIKRKQSHVKDEFARLEELILEKGITDEKIKENADKIENFLELIDRIKKVCSRSAEVDTLAAKLTNEFYDKLIEERKTGAFSSVNDYMSKEKSDKKSLKELLPESIVLEFLKTLCNEGMLIEDEDRYPIENKGCSTYGEFRKKWIIDSDARKISDKIYKLYAECKSREDVLREELKLYIRCFSLSEEFIDYRFVVLRDELSMIAKRLKRENDGLFELLDKKKSLEEQIFKFTFSGVEEELRLLEENIQQLVLKIEQVDNYKLKR